MGWLRDASHAGGRDSRSLRRSGDRLHRVSRAGPPGRRRSCHLPALDRHALRAALEGGSRLLVLRLVLCLHHFRRRYGSLLGAQSGARESEFCIRAITRRHHPQPRTGRHRCGLDLRIRVGRPNRSPRSRTTPLHPGLVSALRAAGRARRIRSGQRRGLRPAIPGRGGPQHSRVLRNLSRSGPKRHPEQQRRCGREADRVCGIRIHGPRAGLPRRHRRPTANCRRSDREWRHPNPAAGHRDHPAGTGVAAWIDGPRWPWRCTRRDRRDALR